MAGTFPPSGDPRGYGERMSDNTSRDTTGMRVVFWVWMGIIVVGLTVMIVTPLTGR